MEDRFVNLGGGNSDFAMTIWGFWISDCMGCYYYLLLTVQMLSFAHCVCARVWERGREREREGHSAVLCVCVCVCARVRERGRHGHITTAACLQTHRSFITVSVMWLCSPLGLELMVKLRTLLTVFTFILKAKACDYRKGRYITDAACGVRPITMHCASWPFRADCACWKEGLCRKWSVWERRGIEDLQ